MTEANGYALNPLKPSHWGLPRVGAAVSGAFDKWYLWGGSVLNAQVDADHSSWLQKTGMIFDSGTGLWRKMPDSSLSARFYHSMTLVGDKLVLWGGLTGKNQLATDAGVFDVRTQTWEACVPR